MGGARLKPGHVIQQHLVAHIHGSDYLRFLRTLKDVIFGASAVRAPHNPDPRDGELHCIYSCSIFGSGSSRSKILEIAKHWIACCSPAITLLFCLISCSLPVPVLFVFVGRWRRLITEFWARLVRCNLHLLVVLFMLSQLSQSTRGRRMLGDLGRHGFAELASSHLSVLLTSPKVPGEWSAGCTATGCWEGDDPSNTLQAAHSQKARAIC